MKDAPWTTANIPDLTGKRAIVTGANRGLGWYTALHLAEAGAEVILTARTFENGIQAVERIQAKVPRADVRFELLDLADLRSVCQFAERISCETRLDLLVNNACVRHVTERRETREGFELQLGTNFLGHFALTALLIPVLLRSECPRITTVSDVLAQPGETSIDFDDLQSGRSYHPKKAYRQSKLACVMFALELARRSRACKHFVSNAADPGFLGTAVGFHLDFTNTGNRSRFMSSLFAPRPADASLCILRAATSPDTVSGDYYGIAGGLILRGAPVHQRVPRSAAGRAAAERLWNLAVRLTRVDFDRALSYRTRQRTTANNTGGPHHET